MRDEPEIWRYEFEGERFCAQCGEQLNEVTVKNGDPFCSANCANKWHGFEPLSRRFTLSGNPAGYTGRTMAPQWDGGARHRARRQRGRSDG